MQGSDLAPLFSQESTPSSQNASRRMGSDAPRRTRAQAGDVTAVNVIDGNGAFSADLLRPVVERALWATAPHRPAAQAALTDTLTQPGLPAFRAERLARAVTGLLAEDRAPTGVDEAIAAYNAAVNAANETYLTAPPPDFVILRDVLVALHQQTRP